MYGRGCVCVHCPFDYRDYKLFIDYYSDGSGVRSEQRWSGFVVGVSHIPTKCCWDERFPAISHSARLTYHKRTSIIL